MSQWVTGGNPAAYLRSSIIQEIDSLSKSAVFSWNGFDYYDPTDNVHNSLTDFIISITHINSFTEDYDGNILISAKKLDEVTKIDRVTGDIIWRLGGKNNEFTLLNDSVFLSII